MTGCFSMRTLNEIQSALSALPVDDVFRLEQSGIILAIDRKHRHLLVCIVTQRRVFMLPLNEAPMLCYADVQQPAQLEILLDQFLPNKCASAACSLRSLSDSQHQHVKNADGTDGDVNSAALESNWLSVLSFKGASFETPHAANKFLTKVIRICLF